MCENVMYRGQERVNEGITKFYENLYKCEKIEDLDDDFYDKCPKLSIG